MAEPEVYEFWIDTYTRETMPMARLAQYLADLAVLLGHKSSVHLTGVEEGSVKPKILIDAPDVPKIRERLALVKSSDGPQDAMRAYRAIDDRLARDNAKASLIKPSEDFKIIEFPGRDRLREILPFSQAGTLDGIVVTVGGRDNPPTVHLEDEGKTYVCHASRALIRRIAPHIYSSPVRVTGTGRWERNQVGDWKLMRFTIHDFKVLKDTPLDALAIAVRSEKVSDWGESATPLEDLNKLRHGE
ncbi:MAG TPA: hypothetical protein VGP62_21930 [Bryobacteraceae bacterium]|jgi:hypothetical protein|nr:hypothetical protein [Bryobacteraceae bacterium]